MRTFQVRPSLALFQANRQAPRFIQGHLLGHDLAGLIASARAVLSTRAGLFTLPQDRDCVNRTAMRLITAIQELNNSPLTPSLASPRLSPNEFVASTPS